MGNYRALDPSSSCKNPRSLRNQLFMTLVILFLISASMAVTSCGSKANQESTAFQKSLAGNHETQAEDEKIPRYRGLKTSWDQLKTPNGFSYSRINVYIKGRRINLLENTSADIAGLLGAITRDNSEPIVGTYFDGFEVFVSTSPSGIHGYFNKRESTVWSGDLVALLIKTSDYYIEGGARVGDSLQSILERYPGGLYNDVLASQSDSGNLHYDYLVMNKAIDWGTGFDFEIDAENRVVSIALEKVDFTP